MSNVLLDKARAILAHPKQESQSKAIDTGEGANKVSMPEPTVLPFTPRGDAFSHASAKNVEIQPAAPNTKAIYWQTGDGRILGPAVPEFLARDGDTFWIVTTFQKEIRWINADQLRSKNAFEEQVEVHETELVRF